VLDLGTGNGKTLFQLRLQGYFRGSMTGIDYSERSIDLAQELGRSQDGCDDIKFEVMDIIRYDPGDKKWWPQTGFDLVLDKGTFDAISLSEEVIPSNTADGPPPIEQRHRIHTVYPSRALRTVKPGGFLLVTSCNWTQEELIRWFTGGEKGVSVFSMIEYPKFKFGGHEGQGVCTVCFRKAPSPGKARHQ
jgi:EEF1A lysine methyltransferase 2